ncbi:MAG: metallophosphoesterase [Candidatus Hydrogenedentes bacterium]|nr:metallophosphoesterase [Candidatus Hydrogenedentota bacterium]
MHRRSFLAGMLFIAIHQVVAAAGETLTERALDQLRATPPSVPDAFDFAVVADTRSLSVTEQSETWKQIIQDVNALRPAFILDVGDLILGGSADLLPAQWNEYERVVADLQVPLFPVTGNHDISDAATEKIWLDRVGPTCYAFSYGNSRFIALNSEEVGAGQRLSDDQIAWLKADLESANAKHIFLFLHKPYFVAGWNEPNWTSSWDNVAEAIKGYPVRIVFGGDDHLYRYMGQRDGVHYVISAGGGAEVRHPVDEGGFHHFVLVRVRGDEVTWSVIKPGSILQPDVVTQARVDEVRNVRRNWVGTETIEAPQNAAFDRKVTAFVQNPYEEPFDSVMAWDIPAGWHVEPPEAAYHAKAGDITYLDFRIWADGPEQVRFPVPTLRTTFKAAKHGGPIDVERRLDLVPAYSVRRANGAVAVDGDLVDWVGAEPIPLRYAWEFDITHTDDLSAQCRLLWDENDLYLAVEVTDDEFHQPYAGDVVWSADGIQLFMTGRWEWGLTLTTGGPEVFLYKGVDREWETVNKDVKLAVRRDGKRTTYEAAFPKTVIAPVAWERGSTFTFSIVANDLDPSHPERPRHWAELTPGVGDAVPGSPMAQLELTE